MAVQAADAASRYGLPKKDWKFWFQYNLGKETALLANVAAIWAHRLKTPPDYVFDSDHHVEMSIGRAILLGNYVQEAGTGSRIMRYAPAIKAAIKHVYTPHRVLILNIGRTIAVKDDLEEKYEDRCDKAFKDV